LNRNIAVGTAILLSLITLAAFFALVFSTLQAINPAAAMAAIVVALVGILWFKKTAKS
jgi:L-arabinose isomerase